MSASNNSQALPLCLPDNCSWDDRTRTYKQDKTKERRALYTVPYTLSRLRAIPGPVCVVSIAGPCRQGKSYIISKVFDQGGVFPLGHLMDPETMGIWVWIVPKKYVDSEGREFTLVLLDSEGTDAVKSNQVHDHSIFTLTVLLSSILIYNSQGVPTRSDLDNLDHIGKLSQRIQIMSSKSSRRAKVSPKKVLPLFIWLLRDVVLRLPPECNTFKEYLQQKVFTSNNQSTGGVAQDILEFFSGFDAFQLPRPSYDPDVLSNIHDATTQINPAFLRGVQNFKKILIKQLEPKRGFHDKELVTGEALALLVEEYVKTLNKPDAVPCIEGAWTLFVDQKFSLAASEAQQLYQTDMEKQFKEKLPCDDNLIRNQHQETLYECLQLFDSHVAGIVEANNNKYRKTFLEFAEKTESEWLRQNNKVTEIHCKDLLAALRGQILDPVLQRLSGSEIARVSSEDLHSAYKSVEEEFKRRSKGPRSLCENYAAIFRMQAEDELQKHYQRLSLCKEYETRIQHERDARARGQEQIQQLKEETGKLRRRRREESEKKMEELIKKREDLKRMAESLSRRMEAQKAEIQTRNTNMRAERERQRADLARRRQNLESSIHEYDTAIKQKEAEIANLRSRL